jgi:excisionase family DNA binding protein
MRPYITTNDVARMLRVCPETVRKIVRNGKLHPSKVGNVYIYEPDEISQYMMMLELREK